VGRYFRWHLVIVISKDTNRRGMFHIFIKMPMSAYVVVGKCGLRVLSRRNCTTSYDDPRYRYQAAWNSFGCPPRPILQVKKPQSLHREKCRLSRDETVTGKFGLVAKFPIVARHCGKKDFVGNRPTSAGRSYSRTYVQTFHRTRLKLPIED
jgi:hypothetical protein